ncbi:MAG: class I SAM-dependent methyltransferase [Erysipelotrichaceae bacterium]|nr:class I SAM-dependent methyltransferase [Erysipelotrichaceae bacterium]
MKPDYKNWVPDILVYGLAGAFIVALILFFVTGAMFQGNLKTVFQIVTGIGAIILAFFSAWMKILHDTFDYNGKRKLSKTIIEGVSEYVHLPSGGKGLDVGCGSGALTIACARRNPSATMTGCDIWSGGYKTVFTKNLCYDNAKAEGIDNVEFVEGNAIKLPFEDESFDSVTSNYVYHNISGHNKQELLLETLRVLKKGGTFAIHDLMTNMRYGDMKQFVNKLREEGYEEVRLIDTADGMFMKKNEAKWLDLAGSTLLVGKK